MRTKANLSDISESVRDFALTEENDGVNAKHQRSLPMAAGRSGFGRFRSDECGLDPCLLFPCELAWGEKTEPREAKAL